MATGQQWAQGLQGMGAWFAGQGPQYEAAKVAQQRTDMEDQLLRDEARQKAMVTDFSRAYAFMKAGKPELAVTLLDGRIPIIEQTFKGDARDTRALRDAIADPARHEEALIELEGFLGAAGALPGGGGAKRTDVFKNGAVLQASSDGSIGLTMPSGQRISPSDPMWQQAISEATGSGVQYAGDVAASQAMGAGGVNIQIEPLIAALVAKSKADVEGETRPTIESDTQKAKLLVDRAGIRLDAGILAASSLPTMYRMDELLDTVKTGGFSKAQADIQRLFGVLPRDVAELQNLMGRNVLSQLKAAFGGNPSEREGTMLATIEAELAKGTGANKAIIKNAIEMLEARAKNGKKAAIYLEDAGSAEEIEGYLNMRLGEPKPTDTGGAKVGSIIEAGGKKYRVVGGDPNDPDVEEVR